MAKSIKRFYVDELGFYRLLDPEQRQYVCSNLSSAYLIDSDVKFSPQREEKLGGDDGYEICFRHLRRDLGISHFDRTDGYEEWKRSWDGFLRSKLITSQPVTLNRELKEKVRSGIPQDYRCKVWTALIRMRTKPIMNKFGSDIYDIIQRDFVSQFPIEIPGHSNDEKNHGTKNDSYSNRPGRRSRSSYLNPIVRSSNGNTNISRPTTNFTQSIKIQESLIDKCFKQIELDLLRTLPNNRHFEDPNSLGIQRVRRVLRAYACFNQSVGYCQGMNRLAAMALLVLPEEEAFWCLVAIIQCIMPKDYYLKPWLAQVDCYVLSDLLEKRMPRLHKHLVKNDIQLTLFTWFFTIFVDGFRPELMLRIWDCFLLEGDKVLFRFALSILYISQEDLLNMNDFSKMSTHLCKLVSSRKLDIEHLFESK